MYYECNSAAPAGSLQFGGRIPVLETCAQLRLGQGNAPFPAMRTRPETISFPASASKNVATTATNDSREQLER